MARLTEDEWLQAQADYEARSLSFNELSEKYGVDKSAISRRRKKENWEKGKSQPLINKKVKIINELKDIEKESQPLSQPHLLAVDEEVKFKLSSDRDMQAIQNKVNQMLHDIDNPNHALALMNATKIHREARLGKGIETQVNVQTNVQNNVAIEWE